MISRCSDLLVWQKGRELVSMIYSTTHNFPAHEQFGLTSQMNRAAVSIPSNIAEGFGRNSDKEFKQFLNIARGSCAELQTQLLLAKDLKYINDKSFSKIDTDLTELHKMLNAFIKKLSTK
jgi:four helix bundle protein